MLTQGERKILKAFTESDFKQDGFSVISKGLVDAAKFISQYNYDFNQLYREYIQTHQNNLVEARDSMWRDLQKQIYGAGPRIASQIIRGLVLKASWKFPLNDNRFLEKCRFNVWIASKTRLNLVTNENEYYDQLEDFANRYLEGNRGIIAHALWYIRKKYCKRPPKCNECNVAEYCRYANSSICKRYFT